jgi:hypothetical protein
MILKKQDKFKWTQEAQEAFEDLKKYLTSPPTLVTLEPHENLHLYISATSNMVSIVIVVERGSQRQTARSNIQSTSSVKC